MEYNHLQLIDMPPTQLKEVAVRMFSQAFEYWPSGIESPDPDPRITLLLLRGNNHQFVNIPTSWKWNRVIFSRPETCVASDILLSMRASIRAFNGALHREPKSGKYFNSSRKKWEAWVALHPTSEPPDEIMEAQKYLKRVRSSKYCVHKL